MKNKQIMIGAILSYASIAINIIAGLLYVPWMIGKIGQSDYGLYTLSNSLISLFLVDVGLGVATSRYVAKYRAEGRQDKIDNFLGAIYKLYLIVDTVIFIALVVIFFAIDNIYVKLTPDELYKFKVIYIVSALFAVINLPFITFNGILSAYEKFIQLKLADVLYRILLVIITVIALFMGYGLYALVLIHAIVGLLITVYKFIIIKTTISVKVNFSYRERELYEDIFKFSAWVTVAFLAQRLIFTITPSILGIVVNTAAIAVFGIIYLIEGYANAITIAINGMFLPKISRIYEQDDASSALIALMTKIGKFQYALNGLLLVGFICVGRNFIHLWLSDTYILAYYGVLLVIFPGLFFNSLQVGNTAMTVRKKVKIQAYINAGTGILNVIFSFILSYLWGVIGACLSIFIAYMLRALVLTIVLHKVMGFDMIYFMKACYLRMGVPILLTVAIGLSLNYFICDGGWIILVIKSLIICFIYSLLAIFMGYTKQERYDVFKLLINKKQ